MPNVIISEQLRGQRLLECWPGGQDLQAVGGGRLRYSDADVRQRPWRGAEVDGLKAQAQRSHHGVTQPFQRDVGPHLHDEKMPIPAQQLQTWSALPNSAPSASTYASVYPVLTGSALAHYSPDVHLQGSYGNATNVRADSDVDVVAELSASWRRNLDALTPSDAARYHRTYSPSSTTLANFKRDVELALRKKYPDQVTVGQKCIKVARDADRLPLDVLPAQEYRLYHSFPNVADQHYTPGIIFTDRDGNQIINYPKPHRDNGRTKQVATGDQYKRLVRTVKNARRKLRDDGVIESSTSPSYFVECLLYNVPDPLFTTDLSVTYYNILQWLSSNLDKFGGLKCQNEITNLFGQHLTEWNTADARRLVVALVAQWNNWSR